MPASYSFGAIPSVFILRYRLLRSRPSISAVRVTFPLASSSFLWMYSRSAASRTSCRLPKRSPGRSTTVRRVPPYRILPPACPPPRVQPPQLLLHLPHLRPLPPPPF